MCECVCNAGCFCVSSVFALIESEGGGWRHGEDNEVGEGEREK